MTKSSGPSLRWKKQNSIVTYVLPNSEVQPEVVGGKIDSPPFVYVHRVHEAFIRHIFGDSEIVALQRILTGNDIAQYEGWKAPHLPPVDRHTKYVFKDMVRNHVSAPLYVCAPVQLTLEMKRDASANVGARPIGGARGELGRSRTFNVQVSAPVDPFMQLEVTTPHQSDGKKELEHLILDYATQLSVSSDLNPDKISYQLYQKYGDYIKGTGYIQVQAQDEDDYTVWRHVDEGRSVQVPLRFYPVYPGKMLLIVAAVDDLGNQVFTDFVGLSYDSESDILTQDF